MFYTLVPNVMLRSYNKIETTKLRNQRLTFKVLLK